MRKVLLIAAVVMLTGCANGFQQYYKAHKDADTMTDVARLADGATPVIQRSDDMKRDVGIALSKGYVIIGQSSLNGSVQSDALLITQAKTVRATLVLLSSNFTETRNITTPLFLPNNQTTYSTGRVNGAFGGANYNTSSTTYGTTVVPITTQQQRYDQNAVYFVKSTKKFRVGVFFENLTPELRTRYERNTGVRVGIVMEGTPAFAANLLPGDVVTEINGAPVVDTNLFMEQLQVASAKEGTFTLKVLRNGAERLVAVQLPAP